MLSRGFYFRRENSLSFAANSVSPAKNSVSSLWYAKKLGCEELTEFSHRRSVRAKKLTEFGACWEFENGVDSARGIAAILVCCRKSLCNSSCSAMVRSNQRDIFHSFCSFECNSLFAIVRVKGHSTYVSSVVAAASIAVAALADLTPSPNTQVS